MPGEQDNASMWAERTKTYGSKPIKNSQYAPYHGNMTVEMGKNMKGDLEQVNSKESIWPELDKNESDL